MVEQNTKEKKPTGVSRREILIGGGAAVAGTIAGVVAGVLTPGVKGPVGPAGPQGPVGPAGPQGPAGQGVSPIIPNPGFLKEGVLKGYANKVIRVDLTKQSITTESLPDESVLRKWIGCYGLGLWYLMRELPDGVSPMQPENPLIFMNGPFTGTYVAGPNNCTITTLNGDTMFTSGRSHSHGYFGPFLKKAGYDGIIITGASDKWVYLWISDNKIELRDASQYLGKDTHETEDLIKDELGINKQVGASDGASVAAIGPAGENVVAGASIMNDKNHGFCHGGVGRVMGSKRLKAIAVRGTSEVSIYDIEKHTASGTQWIAISLKHREGRLDPVIIWGPDFKLIAMAVGLCAKNLLANSLPGFGDGLSRQKCTRRFCYGCPIGCSYDVEMVEGPYKGYVATFSGGMENMEGVAMVGAGTKDPGEIVFLADLTDRLGFEGSSIFSSIAVAFEAYEKGLLTTKETDGLELIWGNVSAIETLIRRVAKKEGTFAQMLSEGPQAAAQRVGLPNAGVHVKGTGMSLHDWRRAWGVLLGQIVGNGSGWPAPGADCWNPDPDSGYPTRTPRFGISGRGQEVAETGIGKYWYDCNGTCWFPSWGEPVLSISSDLMASTVGWLDFTPEEARKVGHRVITAERLFNMAHGLVAEDDLNVSPRLTDPLPPDATVGAGKSIAPYLEGMVRDYYETLGWDRKTGTPLLSTLKYLGLEDLMTFVDK